MARALPEGYVRLGDVARDRLGEQSQYVARFVGGLGSIPDVSDGLRFEGDAVDYHSLLIHRDDVGLFVARVEQWRQQFRPEGG